MFDRSALSQLPQIEPESARKGKTCAVSRSKRGGGYACVRR
jgi:hypothetical protein